MDPYTTLGVSRTASFPEIKRAYYELALRYHPDKSARGGASPSSPVPPAPLTDNSNSDTAADATEKFKKISAAYEKLKLEHALPERASTSHSVYSTAHRRSGGASAASNGGGVYQTPNSGRFRPKDLNPDPPSQQQQQSQSPLGGFYGSSVNYSQRPATFCSTSPRGTNGASTPVPGGSSTANSNSTSPRFAHAFFSGIPTSGRKPTSSAAAAGANDHEGNDNKSSAAAGATFFTPSRPRSCAAMEEPAEQQSQKQQNQPPPSPRSANNSARAPASGYALSPEAVDALNRLKRRHEAAQQFAQSPSSPLPQQKPDDGEEDDVAVTEDNDDADANDANEVDKQKPEAVAAAPPSPPAEATPVPAKRPRKNPSAWVDELFKKQQEVMANNSSGSSSAPPLRPAQKPQTPAASPLTSASSPSSSIETAFATVRKVAQELERDEENRERQQAQNNKSGANGGRPFSAGIRWGGNSARGEQQPPQEHQAERKFRSVNVEVPVPPAPPPSSAGVAPASSSSPNVAEDHQHISSFTQGSAPVVPPLFPSPKKEENGDDQQENHAAAVVPEPRTTTTPPKVALPASARNQMNVTRGTFLVPADEVIAGLSRGDLQNLVEQLQHKLSAASGALRSKLVVP